MIPLRHLEQQDVAHRDDVGERQRGERERLQHRQHLRDDENAMAVPPIDEHTGKRRQHE